MHLEVKPTSILSLLSQFVQLLKEDLGCTWKLLLYIIKDEMLPMI